jgi:tetratricopeptide (TPR) repeat protein
MLKALGRDDPTAGYHRGRSKGEAMNIRFTRTDARPRRAALIGIVLGLVAIVGLPALVLGDPPDERNRPSGTAEDPDYTAGVAAIKAKDYPAAIKRMEAVVGRNGSDADAYNWLAYATRLNGDPAKSIPIYQKALTLNPKHRGAHEYIGEAYLALGDLPRAKEHLAKLNSLCFFPCSEYTDLKKAVQDYEAGGGTTKPASR